MTDDRTADAPPMWRCYKCDDGVWQCHPAPSLGWPKSIAGVCGRRPEPLLEQAHAAMAQVVAPYIAKAVAAELRAQADALRLDESVDEDCDEHYASQDSGFVQGQQDAADRLRARADTLDPKESS